jgi:hypothetical protein
MGIEKLKDKYDPFKKRNEAGQLRRIEDSAKVVRLYEYLGSVEEHGIELVEIDGDPALSFNPGLLRNQTERWDIATRAECLFLDAARDLRTLFEIGVLKLRRKI